ncbi:MAG: hypothetical protein H7174_13605 [Flavobacterium sp.]|nr:hypothetical protein [Flavobacterium sp.]
MELEKKYISKNDTLQINLVKFYLSKIAIEYNDKSNFVEENSYHLIDFEDPKSLQIPVCENNKKIISKINFNIGIDSLSNVSGALSGDLDASKGMYWAWQSGYINMKIEGESRSCKTRKNKFLFHIGGYIKPNNSLRKVELNSNFNENLNLIVDLAQMFNNINLKEKNEIMIPGSEAIQMANLYQQIFRLE